MPERHRLSRLQMRVARHDGVGVFAGRIYQACEDRRQLPIHRVDAVAQPQPHIGGDLIVARARRVQLLARFADEFGEPRLDVHVDVFERFAPDELAALDFAANARQAAHDGAMFGSFEHADVAQHVGMSDGAEDVVVV